MLGSDQPEVRDQKFAAVTPFTQREPKLAKVDAKSHVTDRYLKRLEEEGFVKKLLGR